MSRKMAKNDTLPKGWREVKLGEVCSIDEKIISSKTPDNYCFNYIALSDIDRGNLLQTKKYKFSEAPSRARRVVKRGDVLLATVRPNLQGFYIFKDEVKDCIVSTGFAVLTPKPDLLDSVYLFQILFSHHMLSIYYAANVGSNYPAINSSDISNFKIPIPSLSEQKAIASLLETWDTAIEKTEALITAKEKQFKWLLKTLISDQQDNPEWRRVKLGYICTFEYGKPLKEQDRIGNQYPVFGSNGIIGSHNEYLVVGPFIVIGRKGSAGTVLYSMSSGFPIDTTFLILPDFVGGLLSSQGGGNHHVFEPIVMVSELVEAFKRRGISVLLLLCFSPIGMEVPQECHRPYR